MCVFFSLHSDKPFSGTRCTCVQIGSGFDRTLMQVEAYFASVENTYFVSFTNYNPMLPFNS